MSILEEGQYLGSSPLFSPLVRDALFSPPSRKSLWYLENRIPTLGEVRGKAVLFSRFGGHGEGWPDNKIGIHPPLWPDSAKDGFEWEMADTRVRVHDW
jgi:1-phosphatidylinositol phosphodiesterase